MNKGRVSNRDTDVREPWDTAELGFGRWFSRNSGGNGGATSKGVRLRSLSLLK